MSEDERSQTTPEDRAEELSGLLGSASGTSGVSWSAEEDGAIVTCYAYRDYDETVERIVGDSQFELVHEHEVGDEVHYIFGYRSDA